MLSRKKKIDSQTQLNIKETFNLWDILNSKYGMIRRMRFWLIYVHDPDLKYLMEKIQLKKEKRARDLEAVAKRYSIATPASVRRDTKISTNTELLTDKDIAQDLFQLAQGSLELVLRSMRTSTSNDKIRRMFLSFVKGSINDIDILIRYLKLRGWMNVPPKYPNIPSSTNEAIDVSEAFHLWDLLTLRYDNIISTRLWYEHAHDGDFKLLLKKGSNDIVKQAETLENEVDWFGIPLPERYPEVVKVANTELIEDKYMFRQLYRGMMGSLWVHSLAVKESITNDRVRKLFTNLLLYEADNLTQLIKFGKIKSWLNVVPRYMPNL